MYTLEHKRVLVIGNDPAMRAAEGLLRRAGAQVTHSAGVPVSVARQDYDFAVVSSDCSLPSKCDVLLKTAGISAISDLELAFRQARCLTIAVAGTSGKASTATLIAQALKESGRATKLVGDRFTAICDLVEESRDLDFLTASVSACQLSRTEYFRPTIAVLLNLGAIASDSHSGALIGAANLFKNQQTFDWAIVQSEVCAELRKRNVAIPGKVITFSATDQTADLFLDRGLIISRMEGWVGPLIDMGQTEFRGPHFAENLMAVLATTRVLRLSLEDTVTILKRSRPLDHCCEVLGEKDGVTFINDARSNTVESLHAAIRSVPAKRGEPNIWLIAGGEENPLDYHSVGPLLSQRVKGAFLFGQSREKLRGAWSLFTPCTLAGSLLEAVTQAAAKAVRGDTILFSPACSSSDLFQDDQHRGEVYREQIAALGGTSRGGELKAPHKILNRTV